jgi:hypothetical protein
MSMIKRAAATAAAVAFAATPVLGDLVVNQNLGNLGPGAHPFAGTTIGQPNNADNYAPVSNTAAIWDQEFVYQFTTSQNLVATLNSNDPNGALIDNDFFLLNSLATSTLPSGLRQAQVVHDNLVEVNGSFGLLPAGTYYLSIDAWRGVPGGTTPPTGRAGPFAGTLNLNPVVTPNSTQAFLGGSTTGTLAPGTHQWFRFNFGGGSGFAIDTEGSTFLPSNDTELALFDAQGFLLEEDDDGGTGLLSLITSPAGLPAGTYYLAIGGFNTIWGDGFQATGGSNGGPFVINGLNTIPEPGTLGLLGAAGLLALRRRRA